MLKFLRRFLKDEEDEQEILREKFTHFRRLLENNNQALAAMADMEEKLTGDFLFDTGYLHSQVEKLSGCVREMMNALNCLAQDRYRELNLVYQKLQEDIHQELLAIPEIPQTPYIFFLDQLTREMADSSGGKMANLGEMHNNLRLPTPRGFVITAAAYKHFLEGSGLSDILADKLQNADVRDLVGLEAVSQELQDLIKQAAIPADLAQAITEAGQIFAGNYISVRSSAVGEDTECSFAGQFATVLNVPPAGILDHYKEVVASKFTSQAIFYWKYQNFSLNELPMAVGCLEMVPAHASGVMFSLNPHAPEKKSIVISAVWGLGKFAVDGTVSPDIFELSKDSDFAIIHQRLATKMKALIPRSEGGVEEIPLSPEKAASPCLNEEQLRSLAAVAVQLEHHFRAPQDIEWAVDTSGQIILLQSRPLRISEPTFQNQKQEKPEIATPPLLNHGVRAVGGCGWRSCLCSPPGGGYS